MSSEKCSREDEHWGPSRVCSGTWTQCLKGISADDHREDIRKTRVFIIILTCGSTSGCLSLPENINTAQFEVVKGSSVHVSVVWSRGSNTASVLPIPQTKSFIVALLLCFIVVFTCVWVILTFAQSLRCAQCSWLMFTEDPVCNPKGRCSVICVCEALWMESFWAFDSHLFLKLTCSFLRHLVLTLLSYFKFFSDHS